MTVMSASMSPTMPSLPGLSRTGMRAMFRGVFVIGARALSSVMLGLGEGLLKVWCNERAEKQTQTGNASYPLHACALCSDAPHGMPAA